MIVKLLKMVESQTHQVSSNGARTKDASFGVPKKSFDMQTTHLSSVFSQLRWKLAKLSELKRAGTRVNDSRVQELN